MKPTEAMIEAFLAAQASARDRTLASPTHPNTIRLGLEAALALAPDETPGIDAACCTLAAWLGLAWEGLPEPSCELRGYKPWAFDGLGDKRFQGGRDDLRAIVRQLVAAAGAPGEAVAMAVLAEREACAAIADIWADTRPNYGPHAKILASAMSDAGRQVAAAIRARGGEHG